MPTPVVTRFAPSPTGYLHIGGARTALFAWAFARQQGGRFYLRVEDTDVERSSSAHGRAIVEALDWLGLSPDAAPVFQSRNLTRHQAVAERLVEEGRAYRCYATVEELSALRAAQIDAGETPRYDRRWRDADATPPAGVRPSVRFKMPLEGETVFDDAVKGRLAVGNAELDDFVILRSDGLPTYNFAAVVDDVDMGITHVVRGDDHVMNTYRQWHVFRAVLGDGTPPIFAHLPMILAAVRGDDGAVAVDDEGRVRYERMSKRNAAVDIGLYRQEGILAEALCNYLARLSWAHGDAECFDRDFLVRHFDFSAVSLAPARFDREKLDWLSREHLRRLEAPELRRLAGLPDSLGDEVVALMVRRATTLNDLREAVGCFLSAPSLAGVDWAGYLGEGRGVAFDGLVGDLGGVAEWREDVIKRVIKETAKRYGLSFRDLGMPMRLALTGGTDSPDIATVAMLLGQGEVLRRLASVPR